MIHCIFGSSRTYGLGGEIQNVFFSHYANYFKESIMADFYGPESFPVEHIELHLCVKSGVNQSHV